MEFAKIPNEDLSVNQLKLLIRTRLDLESEFVAGRKKKFFLWGKVLEEMLKVYPELKMTREQITRKFLNLVTTYKRIKERGKASSWEFFDDFEEVYGTRKFAVQSRNRVAKDSVFEEVFMEPELEITHVLPSESQKPSNSSSSSTRQSNLTQPSEDEAVLSKVLRLIDKPTDDYQVFGDYVATEFRLLKSEKNRLLLRQKIQRAILEVSEIDAGESAWNDSKS